MKSLKTLRKSGIVGVASSADPQRPSFAHCNVIVATIQSLYLDPPTRSDGRVVLVADECHRYGSKEWRRALHASYRRRLGLTATFERNDDGIDALMRYFGGGPVYTIGFPQAIQDGAVARYDVELLGVDLNEYERKKYADADRTAQETRLQLIAAGLPEEPFGAWMTAVQEALDDSDPTIEDVARKYLRAFSQRVEVMTCASQKIEATRALGPAVNASSGAIVFTRLIDMTDEIADALVESGVQALPVHSALTRSERRERLLALKVGRAKALVAPSVLDEGIDVPDIDLAVVMGGSRSRRQMIQRMGRVLRLKDDGRRAKFVVVFARDTAEDLTATNGVESCLDLIVESADSVTELLLKDGEITRSGQLEAIGRAGEGSEATATKSVVQSPEEHTVQTPAVERVEDEHVQTGRHHMDIDPTTLPMTKMILKQYTGAHGGTVADAEAALRAMLKDFLATASHSPVLGPRDTRSLVKDGLVITVNRDRFVRYATQRRDGRSWSELTSDGPARDISDIDAMLVGFDFKPVFQASQIYDVGDPFTEEALNATRSLFSGVLERHDEVLNVDGFTHIVSGDDTWILSGDMQVVLALDHRGARLTDGGAPAGGADVPEREIDDVSAEEPGSEEADQTPPQPGDAPKLDAGELVGLLERLAALHEKGLLTDDEFGAAKARLLA